MNFDKPEYKWMYWKLKQRGINYYSRYKVKIKGE